MGLAATPDNTWETNGGKPGERPAQDGLSSSPILQDYRTMQDLVFATLRDDIFAGRMKPGERLNSSLLARRLGVSRMPIREALSRLISVGLVENIPHRGAFVKKLSIEEVIEIYYIRAALEGIAARMAARNLSPEDARRLTQLCDEMMADADQGHDGRFLELNFTFHNIIYRAARSTRLEGLILQYYRYSEPYRALGLDLPGRFEEILAEHCQLARALVARDPDLAEKCAREHHLNTARRIARSVGSTSII